MKTLSTLMLCLCCTSLFAQNGFFLQPEIAGGAGYSRSGNFRVSLQDSKKEYRVFSYQGTLEVGYRYKKWELVSGIGYFSTGYSTVPIRGCMAGGVEPNSDELLLLTATHVYDPHIIVPVKVGYQLLHQNRKLTLTPYAGAEFAYNTPRKFYDGGYARESAQSFDVWCNHNSLFVMAQLSLEYTVTKHIEFTAGLSANYELNCERKPLVNEYEQHDYAAMVNFGMRYNFGHKTPNTSVAE